MCTLLTYNSCDFSHLFIFKYMNIYLPLLNVAPPGAVISALLQFSPTWRLQKADCSRGVTLIRGVIQATPITPFAPDNRSAWAVRLNVTGVIMTCRLSTYSDVINSYFRKFYSNYDIKQKISKEMVHIADMNECAFNVKHHTSDWLIGFKVCRQKAPI